MSGPEHFRESRVDVRYALMLAYPLATLVSCSEEGPALEHLPLRLSVEADGPHLHGHVARANPFGRRDGSHVTAVFQGPRGYVSPSWYVSKAGPGRIVPTWNYALVHAHTLLRSIDDPSWLARHVDALTTEHEVRMVRPWRIANASPASITRLTGAIVGIDLRVERLEGKFKLRRLPENHVPDRAGFTPAFKALKAVHVMGAPVGVVGIFVGRRPRWNRPAWALPCGFPLRPSRGQSHRFVGELC